MRTRNADTPKSAATKKTPPTKKAAAAASSATAETTPKSTPKTPKAAAKKLASKAAATAAAPVSATSDPKPDIKVEELEGSADPVEAKKAVTKKAPAKAKSPVGAKAAEETAAVATPEVKMEETVEELAPEEKMEESIAEEEPVTPVAASSEPKPEEKVEETAEASAPVEAKKPAAKKPVAKAKSPLSGKAPDAVVATPEVTAEENVEEPPPPVEEKPEESKAEEKKEEPMEEEPENDANEEEAEQQMEEATGEEHKELGEEEAADKEEEKEEDDAAEVDLQMEISDMANARKIKKEQEIFVGGLDRDAVEDDIKKAFEKVGEVVEVRLHRDFVTNKNKGFAFVKFASKELAAKALAELKNPLICGKRCGIAPSEDNDTLFLGNICNTWTKEAIKRKLKDYGIDTVESITLVADTQNEGVSRGFAFLEFPCHADAMLAYQRLQKPDVIFGHPERTAKVAFAEPIREPDPEIMAQVKSVFVDGLPPHWDEDRVKEQFKEYGEIERVVLARNMSTARRNDFGFVNFVTHDAAVAFIEGVNNTELGDGKSKVKVRARLANPLPKTQAVKGGMSGGFRIGHTGIGYSRFGRGFGRGRFPFQRGGFQGSRGFYPRGRGRGRFPFAGDNNIENQYSEFRGGWRPFGARGGRRISTSARRGGFDRGRGNFFPGRRQPFPPERDFGGPFVGGHLDEDPYFYGDGGRGIKRPFSMMEHDPAYFGPGSRIRPRYDHPDPMPGGSRYRDTLEMTGLYSRDYYGSDYGDSAYSSFYGGESSGRGYYY